MLYICCLRSFHPAHNKLYYFISLFAKRRPWVHNQWETFIISSFFTKNSIVGFQNNLNSSKEKILWRSADKDFAILFLLDSHFVIFCSSLKRLFSFGNNIKDCLKYCNPWCRFTFNRVCWMAQIFAKWRLIPIYFKQ